MRHFRDVLNGRLDELGGGGGAGQLIKGPHLKAHIVLWALKLAGYRSEPIFCAISRKVDS